MSPARYWSPGPRPTCVAGAETSGYSSVRPARGMEWRRALDGARVPRTSGTALAAARGRASLGRLGRGGGRRLLPVRRLGRCAGRAVRAQCGTLARSAPASHGSTTTRRRYRRNRCRRGWTPLPAPSPARRSSSRSAPSRPNGLVPGETSPTACWLAPSISEAITGEFLIPAPLAALRRDDDHRHWPPPPSGAQRPHAGRVGGLHGQLHRRVTDYADNARAGRSVLTGPVRQERTCSSSTPNWSRADPSCAGGGSSEIAGEVQPRRPTRPSNGGFSSLGRGRPRRGHRWDSNPALARRRSRPPGPKRRRSVPRLVEDVGPALGALAQRALGGGG